MTLTQNGELCDMCETPLSGGRDTYGAWDESLCFSCYMERANQPDPELERLKFELEEAESHLRDAEADYNDARERKSRHENRCYEVQQEIEKINKRGLK